MQDSKNWIYNPTKKQMICFVLLWLTGFILITLDKTNLLTETPFKRESFFSFFIIIFSGLTVYKVCKNYYNNKKNNNPID